ncbi:LysR family transcriptional regulator [Aliikangiella coralliicola]|uniref:LysR family transcriptional regulator n=1 Tax=Aliikangiella coralliicola TaxID=2592383 RepID=A0A545UJV9_9GAMM|nr:LysR family transcriptional regulator [Aliikangiella coralliicola]TQV89747.1 LysR family transcriptional regulator [Aliikangiella coralliicola]
MKSLNDLPIFVAVAESGGFSSAARVLDLSKSAVSKRITQLEQHLGARLFHRTTRHLSLTEAGVSFYDSAAAAVRCAQDAEDAVSALLGEPRGHLKIAVPLSFGQLHVSRMIPEFLNRYPLITIDLVMEDGPINLLDSHVDVALLTGKLPDSSLIARRLLPLRSITVVSPTYTAKTSLSCPKDLLEENCITRSTSSNKNVWSFISKQHSYELNVTGNYSVNNSEALKEAALNGVGIARLPTFVVGEYIANKKLVHLFPDFAMPELDLHLVYPERNYLPQKVKVFNDFAREFFGGDTPYWEKGLLS